MILALDCETQGLSGKMIECCIYKSQKVQFICKNKKEVWSTLITIAEKENKRKRNVYIYAHNMKFDFFKIIDWNIKGIKIKNDSPFIAEYRNGNKICFLDTWGLFRMSLKKSAELIGERKLDIGKELIQEGGKKESLTKEERTYMIKDAEICYKLVKRIHKELQDYNQQVKTVVTLGQIGINTFLSWCKKNNYHDLFEDEFRNILIQPKYGKEIHKSYRYGRIEIKRTKEKNNVYEVDVNNLYSYVAMKNPFPDLKSERMIKKPLETLSIKGFYHLLKQYPIGAAKCILSTPKNALSYGVLVTRTKTQRYFPKKGIIAGTWTNIEIDRAIQKGYTILGCEYIITFNQAKKNPFKEYFKEIYNRRKNGDKFSDYFWKQIANYTIGKFAQINERKEYIIDDIMKVNEYYSKGYEFVKSYGTNYLYCRKTGPEPSKFYCIILSAMINAYAKIYHYNYLEKIPYDDFVYCDTDNIIFKNKKNLKNFPIGKNIGEFKISHNDTSFHAYNKKTYRIGNEIKASGMRKTSDPEEQKLQLKQFEEGEISYKRMIGIQQGKSLEEAGQFEQVHINLLDSVMEKVHEEDDIENTKLFLDAEEKFDIEYIRECIGGK